jgi:hypothetical protein
MILGAVAGGFGLYALRNPFPPAPFKAQCWINNYVAPGIFVPLPTEVGIPGATGQRKLRSV